MRALTAQMSVRPVCGDYIDARQGGQDNCWIDAVIIRKQRVWLTQLVHLVVQLDAESVKPGDMKACVL